MAPPEVIWKTFSEKADLRDSIKSQSALLSRPRIQGLSSFLRSEPTKQTLRRLQRSRNKKTSPWAKSSQTMAIKIGILGAGKVGIAIAALLDVMRFVDSVILADVDTVENLDALRKVRFRKLDVLSAPDLANFVSDCDAIVSAAPYYLNKTIAEACAR